MAAEQAPLERVLGRLEGLMQEVETRWLRPPDPNWEEAVAFRWRRQQTALGSWGALQPIRRRSTVTLGDLQHLESAKQRVCRNTEQFLRGLPANNVLLTGARGTGKSSLIKACLNAYADQGLRLIEVDKADLVDLDAMVEMVAKRPEKFIIFCDDLSFEAGETGYKALKVALDGSVAAASGHVLIYATSNRRHLMPERMSDNRGATYAEDGEIHPGETSEEQNALAERFGIWVAFYPLRQDDYLAVVTHWLHRMQGGVLTEDARSEALRWALERGSRSGRVAWQFACDWVGRNRLGGA